MTEREEETAHQQRILPTLDQFLNRARAATRFGDRSFVYHEDFKSLYVRYACHRYIAGKHVQNVLDIASVEAWEPRTGAFTRLVDRVREHHPDLIIFVENVLNPDFGAALMRRGYQHTDADYNMSERVASYVLWRTA